MLFLMFSDFWVELLRLTNKLMKLAPTVLFFSSPDLREHVMVVMMMMMMIPHAGDATHWTGWERKKRCTDPMSFVFPLLFFLRCWISS